ncbi:MAG: glycoside hydrolase family 127 protein [Armatimonadetes bacterium]|nr:glycoside hydrolase family 127 protein [Armatimonadota bacterium]MDE2205695.1 glycoside hydrolase family 127 protein [Armatimonadota bacterium]
MQTLRKLSLLALFIVLLLPSQSPPAANKGNLSTEPHPRSGMLQPFRYPDVMLTGGPLDGQASGAKSLYLGLSNDSLLKGFRQRAGLPAPGRNMGGWYDPGGFAAGHSFGQYLSALARYYANTHDSRFKAKVTELVHGFDQTIAPDGFFYATQQVARDWPDYVYDKNCTGMRDAWNLTGDGEALVVLKKMTDWAWTNLPRRHDEWYTLPENLYKCYALTRDPRYLTMARQFDYSADFYQPLANGINAFTPNRHAYSHVNTLASAARAYQVTGDETYFRAIQNAWTFLTTTQMVASGGWGPNERFVTPGAGKLAASVTATGAAFETPCGSYATVNLDRYLLRFTGDAKYGDNMERVLLNGMLAALPEQPSGRTFYYSDYRPGTKKAYYRDAWPCCSGTYAEITADYPLDVYFHTAAGLTVNLFTPSTVQWRVRGSSVSVSQATSFPTSNRAGFTVRCRRPTRFALQIRVPQWVSGPVTARLNSRLIHPKAVPGAFLEVNRLWHDRDTLTVTLPMALRLEPIAPETPQLAALMYGPVLLVAISRGAVVLPVSGAGSVTMLKRVPAAPLTFQTADGSLTFRPLYQVRSAHYTTYLNVQPGQRVRLRPKSS